MRYFKISFLAAALLSLLMSCDHAGKSRLNPWPEISSTTRPWTRWWWMGNAVNSQELGSLLDQYHEAGFGGVEITPVYGVKGFGEQYIDFLSPAWMDMLHYTTGRAGSLGMQVDMNLGTGWPFGGPQITPEYAASELIVQTYSMTAGNRLNSKIIVEDSLQRATGAILVALTAYNTDGERVPLTGRTDTAGYLDWTPGPGTWQLYAAFEGKTGQRVKRAAPGGEGLVMDHLSEAALKCYLNRFDAAFGSENPAIRCYFNDSYEVYHASYSSGLFDEFLKRRGYDARTFLKELVSREDNDTVERVQADYRLTMAEMLLNNFTRPWSEWIHHKQALSRNQAHGSPGNLLDLYAAVDIPECETFGSNRFSIPGLHDYSPDTIKPEPDPVMMKFASSAAHVMGKPLISSETFTWLGEHFKVPLSECKPEAEMAFLSGVNHLFYHGTAYSPGEVSWPGWLFYASVNFSPSNTFWTHLKGLNDYITRCQSVLQAGRPDNDILVYWPVNDIWHRQGPLELQLSTSNIDDWLVPTPFYSLCRGLMDKGYTLDFLSDDMISKAEVEKKKVRISPEGAAYKIIVVPDTRFMPLSTLHDLLRLARNGAVILFESLPSGVPGMGQLASRTEKFHTALDSLSFTGTGDLSVLHAKGGGMVMVSEDVTAALTHAGVQPEGLTGTGLKFVRRRVGEETWYYLVNHSASTVDGLIPLNVRARSAILLDPQNGQYGIADVTHEEGKILVRLTLEPGQTLFVCATDHDSEVAAHWKYVASTGTPLVPAGPWTLKFITGGPVLPTTRQIEEPVPWTSLHDSLAQWFSGTAEYSVNFDIDSLSAGDYLLEPGDLLESAHVWVNDHDAGIIWSLPYKLRIGQFLRKGNNTLRIEVANLMANRIIYMDKKGIEWRKFHDINFVNQEYKPFDASAWDPLPSGLSGPVRIVPVYFTAAPQEKASTASR